MRRRERSPSPELLQNHGASIVFGDRCDAKLAVVLEGIHLQIPIWACIVHLPWLAPVRLKKTA
jgi:hypothetical protein